VVEHADFAALFHAEYAKLCRISARFVRDRGLAEQIVSESFLKVWRHRDHVDWSHPFPYLYRVVINECKDTLESNGRQRETANKLGVLELVPRQRTSGDDPGPRVTGNAAVVEHLSSLPLQQRTVVILRVYEDLPEADVAEIMGISIGSVKSHYSRALTALRHAVAGGVTA
jgi:RNA polymerase sigma factor (sigma-70 family)